jgi:hypothetical protein
MRGVLPRTQSRAPLRSVASTFHATDLCSLPPPPSPNHAPCPTDQQLSPLPARIMRVSLPLITASAASSNAAGRRCPGAKR